MTSCWVPRKFEWITEKFERAERYGMNILFIRLESIKIFLIQLLEIPARKKKTKFSSSVCISSNFVCLRVVTIITGNDIFGKSYKYVTGKNYHDHERISKKIHCLEECLSEQWNINASWNKWDMLSLVHKISILYLLIELTLRLQVLLHGKDILIKTMCKSTWKKNLPWYELIKNIYLRFIFLNSL